MAQTITDAINLNNEGTDAFLCGKMESAMRSLKDGLTILKDLHANSPKPPSSNNNNYAITSKNNNQNATQPNQKSILNTSKGSTHHSLPNKHHSFLYCHAFTIDEAMANHTSGDFVSAVSLYNAALIYHIQGCAFKSKRHIDRAQAMYDMSVRLILRCTTNIVDCQVLEMVCWNNLAQIYYGQGKYIKARKGLELVNHMIKRCNGAESILDISTVKGFLFNILFLKAPTTALAA